MFWRMRALESKYDSLDAISRSLRARIPISLRRLLHITTPLLFAHSSFSSSFILFILPNIFCVYLQTHNSTLFLFELYSQHLHHHYATEEGRSWGRGSLDWLHGQGD